MGGTLAQYGGQRRALANRRTFGSIRELYGRSNMAADAGTMVGGALDNYGRLLMRGARAGGVMPNYYAPLWERLSRGWEDYGADMHAMEFNALQRDYTYRAQRLANNMQLYNALLNSAFDIYEHGRGSVARTSHTRARTAEEGII
jgi:hypothetical protein